MLPRYLLKLLALSIALEASAQEAEPRVVNGVGELGEPTSVGLVQGAVPEDGYLVCSGVLVGCDSVLTTAHCFNVNASLKTHIFIPHAGFFEIESATRHPAYVDAITNQPPGWIDTTREEDISFVKLASPVSGLTPARLFAETPQPGTPGFVVGFGRDPISEAGVENPGLKRSGSMMLDTCTDPALQGLDLLCWSPTDPLPDPGEEVSTCTGDSGGPLFTWIIGTRLLSGITKGAILDPQGQPDLCEPPVHPYDVNLQRHLLWIRGNDGAGGMVAATGAVPLGQYECDATPPLPEIIPSTSACDSSPMQRGDPGRSCGFEGALGGGNPASADYAFQVPFGASTLRVALNGFATSSPTLDTNLYVREGAPATPALHDCAADGLGTLGFCEWAEPGAGSWFVHVDQPQDEGDHQVIVTLLAAPAPPPVHGPSPAAGALLALVLVALARSAMRRSPVRS